MCKWISPVGMHICRYMTSCDLYIFLYISGLCSARTQRRSGVYPRGATDKNRSVFDGYVPDVFRVCFSVAAMRVRFCADRDGDCDQVSGEAGTLHLVIARRRFAARLSSFTAVGDVWQGVPGAWSWVCLSSPLVGGRVRVDRTRRCQSLGTATFADCRASRLLQPGARWLVRRPCLLNLDAGAACVLFPFKTSQLHTGRVLRTFLRWTGGIASHQGSVRDRWLIISCRSCSECSLIQ